jgi:[glutamine synthetase] adenylyltransferase / [glutamine synthetase]-adenylyl-L-tyrosine phosphorylase
MGDGLGARLAAHRYRAGVSIPRGTTLAGRLASLGFADADRAERLITDGLALDIQGADADLIEALAAAADPDAALAGLARLAHETGLLAALRADPDFRLRLTAVLGASTALGDHLARHPGEWRVLSGPDAVNGAEPGALRAELLTSAGADPADPEPASVPARLPGQDPATSLRIAYRRGLLRLAARDLTGAVSLDQAAAELADLAAAALEAALAIARAGLPPGAARARLAVIAMGKCGGRELNYASDVDVIFVAEPADADALRTATRLAAGLIRVCSQSTA